MTPDLNECLYSQKFHAEYAGYYVFELEKPMEVDEYAIAVTYPTGAPVEGKAEKLDTALYTEVTSKDGQSFILVDGKWLDMSNSFYSSTNIPVSCGTLNLFMNRSHLHKKV